MDGSNVFGKYEISLDRLPCSGSGLHSGLLSVANLGVIKGVRAQDIFCDLRSATEYNQKGRYVSDNEIWNAIKTAQRDCIPRVDYRGVRKYQVSSNVRKPLYDPKLTQKLIDEGNGVSLESIIRCSPEAIQADGQFQLLLEKLYQPDDFIFVGKINSSSVIKVSDVLRHALIDEHISPNTFTGEKVKAKNGNLSYRSDSAVKEYRYAMVEFDELSLQYQVQFWAACPLPIGCLIYSGNKSIHAWIDVRDCNIKSQDEWNRLVKNELFFKRLTPLGVDTATSNPSRMSRSPSFFRNLKDCRRMQKLIYLDTKPNGNSILSRF